MLNKKRIGIFSALIAILLFFFFSKSPQIPEVQNSPEVISTVPISAPTPLKVATVIPSEKSKPSPTVAPLPPNQHDPMVTPQIKEAREQAKRLLSSAYTSLRATRMYFGRYTTDFQFSGFTPLEYQDSEIIDYKIGFLESFHPEELFDSKKQKLENPEFMSSDAMIESQDDNTKDDRNPANYSKLAQSISLNKYAKYCKMGCTATPDGFEILLVRPLEGHGNDVWLINDKKELVLACDGLKGDC